MAPYVMVLRGATSLGGALEGVGPENRARASWAQKNRVMMLHPSKPLSISAIKTTGILVVLCNRVLLCVRGVGRSPCICVV